MDSGLTRSTSSDRIPSTDSVKLSTTRIPSLNDLCSNRNEVPMRTRSPSVTSYSNVIDATEVSPQLTFPNEANKILHQPKESPEETERTEQDAPRVERCASTTSKESVAKTTERKRARKSGQELELNRLKCNLNDLPMSSSRRRSHFNNDYVFPEQKKNKRKEESFELSQSTIPPVLSNIGDTPSEKGNEIITVSDDLQSGTQSLNMSAKNRTWNGKG